MSKGEYFFIKTNDAFDGAIENVRKRITGEFFPISTGWPHFDHTYFNGFEEGWIVAIAGKSGSGKTAFMSQMLHGMSISNDQPIGYIIFSFEMRPSRMLQRMICYTYDMSMRELYAVAKEEGSNITMKKLEDIALKGIPFLNEVSTFVEKPLYPEEIRRHVHKFNNHCTEKFGSPITIVAVIDHILLTKGAIMKTGIDDLILMENELKKEIPNLLQINLSQLNRSADAPERYDPEKPSKHYPIKSDLYGSDVIWQTCDSVITLNNPSSGGLSYYGPEGFRAKQDNGLPRVFAHHLKARDSGDGSDITLFEFNGKHFKFNEIYDFDATPEEDRVVEILDDDELLF